MKHILLGILISISYFSFSQSEKEPLDITIDSKVFEDERTISVFLPNRYFEENSTENFTVAYVFDGQFEPYFSMVSSIMSYYEQTDEGVPMIIVGIHTNNRWGEFVPTIKEEKSDKVENAEQLSLFLKSEVMPRVDSMYRTKDFNVGIGHSLGGTFVINEVIQQVPIFDAVIAVSPNLRMYNEQILQDAKSFFTKNPENRRFIYASVGTEGAMEQSFRNSLENLDTIVSSFNLKNMYWKYDLFQKANHMTTFVQSFDAGYRALSLKLALLDDKLIEMAQDTTIEIVQNIENYYKELSAFTKENKELNLDQLMQHSRTLLQYGMYKPCMALCEQTLERIEIEDIPSKEKKKKIESLNNRKSYSEFMLIIEEAKKQSENENYTEASELYLKAFDLGVKRGTHIARMGSIPSFAQTGNHEEAFKQLDLLANYFELGGNGAFINDERLSDLHGDKRWSKLMAKLKKNAEKYR